VAVHLLDKLRQPKRTVVARVARMIARHAAAERWLIAVARNRPNARPVQWLCESLGRAVAGRPDRFRTVTVQPGASIVIDISDFLRHTYFYGAEYEPEVTAILRRVLRPGDVAIDVGANAGYHTILMAMLVAPHGVVHAFEPVLESAALMRRSIALNGIEDRVHVRECAVAERQAARVPFHMSALGHNSGVASLERHESGAAQGFFSPDRLAYVSTTTLDEYCSTAGIRGCRVVKIDVEAAEARVVQGMPRLLASGQPSYVVCETAIGGEADRALQQAGYDRWALERGGPVPPSNGWWGNVLYARPTSARELGL
jgi:FkbM family methyltransferase